MFIYLIVFNNFEGFIMVFEVLEEFKVGFNWSFLLKFMVYGGDDWNIFFILSVKLGCINMVIFLF